MSLFFLKKIEAIRKITTLKIKRKYFDIKNAFNINASTNNVVY